MKRTFTKLIATAVFGFLMSGVANAQMVFSTHVQLESDDMEESISTGSGDAGSSDLEFVQESTSNTESLQRIAIRFESVNIPKDAVVSNAYIQFSVDETKSLDPCQIVIRAEDSENASTYTGIAFDLRDRTKSELSVVWNPAAWPTVGARGVDQRTSNIASLVQFVVDNQNWQQGNAMSFHFEGTGTRTAEARESGLETAPELVIEYTSNTAPIGNFPIEKGAIWSYWDNGTNPGENWTTLDFDDAAWAFGSAELGYGDGDENTVLSFGDNSSAKHPAYFFRHKFMYTPGDFPIEMLYFDVLRDDGVVLYLNGVEVVRDNMPAGEISYTTFANGTVDGSNERTFFRFEVPANLLNVGLNVIAASIHQDRPTSSDISFNLEVTPKPGSLPMGVYPMPKNSAWAYWDQGTMPENWNQPTFDHNDWSFGFGPLGYGDPVNTSLSFGTSSSNKHIAYYFRHQLEIENIALLPDTIEFNIRRDDGAVVYLNGVELFRTNMPEGEITNTTLAVDVVDGSAETTYNSFRVLKSMFVEGVNTIAVSVHQQRANSSDMTFDMEIRRAPERPRGNLGCIDENDTHIACFTSVTPGAQEGNLIIPETHRFQKVVEQGDLYTKQTPGVSFTTVPGLPDFTAFVGKNGSNTEGVIAINHENTPGGVTIVDTHFDEVTQLWVFDTIQAVNFYDNDLVSTTRNCSGGITPWGTIITAEETRNAGDANGDGYTDVGWLVEIDPWTKEVKEYGNGKKEKLWAMGRMSHENIVVAMDSLTAYYAEDNGSGALYKFVADEKTNLSSGTLYALKLDAPLDGSGDPTVATGTWIQIPNTTQEDRNATYTLASGLGATPFRGPEDVEISPIDDKIYFTSKSNNRVYRFRDAGNGAVEFETFVGGMSYQINDGENVISEAWASGNDNLTFDDRGNLWVLQDGSRNHMWFVHPDHTQDNPKVELFAKTPAGTEPCGFHFTPDNKYGFVSFMHPSSGNASTSLEDVAGNEVTFAKNITVIIARKEFLGREIVLETDVASQIDQQYVYPNPTDGILNLRLSLKNAEKIEGKVVDINGKVVYSFKENLLAGSQNFELDIRNLSSGQYIIIVQTGDAVDTFKIVKQ